MNDLISKSALLDWLAPFEDMEKVGMPQIIEVIQSRPTIEAAPVVHGHWNFPEGRPLCCVCYEEPYRKSNIELPKYCASCGARMDGESNG